MTSQVLFVGCARRPRGDGDEQLALSLLREWGVHARWAAWDDPDVDFPRADLVVLRASWDYPDRREEFLDWCEHVPRLRNAEPVVRWNTDKTYLADLAAAGVPIVDTELLRVGERPGSWPEVEFVLKPAVGVGSIGAARFWPGTGESASRHLDSLHGKGHTVVLQPYQARVDAEGETALVFLGGTYSHAFTKGPMLTGSPVDGSGLYVSERLGLSRPDTRLRTVAEDALDAVSDLFGIERTELLYARVDVVTTDSGAPALLELELTEPSLGLRYGDSDASRRLAAVIRRELS